MANLSSRVNKNTNSTTKGVAIADNVEFEPCVAVNAAVAGSLTVTWLDDSTTTFYFVQGMGNILQIKKVGAGAAAAGLVALYNT
jgi:hypothetical protein